MNLPVNFKDIRPIESSQRKGFEELCSQLAHQFEDVPDSWRYTRIGDPDAGIECRWESPEGNVWGWQAKYVDSINNSSLSQIDDSIEKALDTYPNLTRYYICAPCDRPHSPDEDGRTKTALEKWEDREKKWLKWADDRGVDVEFIFWGHSRIIELLSQNRHRGRLFFWFDSEQLTNARLEGKLDETIGNAKDRYSPELHVDVSISDVFEPLGRIPQYGKEVDEQLDDLDEKAGDLFIKRHLDVLRAADEDNTENLQSAVEKITDLFQGNKRIPEPIPITALQDACQRADEAIWELEPALRSLKEEADEEKEATQTPEKAALHHFNKLRRTLQRLRNFINSKDLAVAERSALKVLGEAGMGKTHLLCNVAKNRMDHGYPTILLLGEHFSDRDVWAQIIEHLGLDCTPNEFLGALDAFGESRGVRSLIMIDALNESSDPRMWNGRLPGVLRKLEDYPYVGICVSCRSGYENLVFPDTIDDQLVELWHHGFNEVEYEAVRKFFDEHGIEHSSVPVLQREFRIPLFLKLFCENLERRGKSRISHGPEGLSEIFEGYIDGVHDRLHPRLDYDPGDNLVRHSVDALARELARKGGGTKSLPKDEAKEIVNGFLPGKTYSNSLYRHLLSEGIISEVVHYTDDGTREAVRFSYDKFADHVLAQQYLGFYVNGDFALALSKQDKLREIFDDPERYAGLIEAFAFHLPRWEDAELFELVDSDGILNPFIRSLGWRRPETLADPAGDLKDEIKEYLLEEIKHLDDLHDLWRVHLTLATSPDHPLNAEHLHDVLFDLDVAVRDHDWSLFLHEEWDDRTSEVHRLINWGFALENEPIESYELKRLMSITLAWFLPSSNRYVRDRATKAIVNVVNSDIDLCIELIEMFQEVNDPYVIERVYAATYGAVLRNKEHDAIPDIADTVYRIEFEDGDPTPHLLTRDYARGIVELADYHNSEYDVDVDKVRPSYDSSFSIEVPSPDELRETVENRLEEAESEPETNFWLGLAGTDFQGDGWSDFARYIVGTNHGSGKVHGYNFSGDKALRWITKRVFDLGWHPDAFASFDDFVNRRYHGRRENTGPERVSKKYQWIAYYELVAWITDNCEFSDDAVDVPYTGPWDFHRRDIDPSMLLAAEDSGVQDSSEPIEYDCQVGVIGSSDWVSDSNEYPDLGSYLKVRFENDDYISLFQRLSKTVDDENEGVRRKFFCHYYGYLVDESDQEEFIEILSNKWIDEENIYLEDLRTIPTLTDVFVGEYPWHPSANHDSGTLADCNLDVERTAVDLHWESEYDGSVQESVSMLVPSNTIIEEFDLDWSFDTYQLTSNDDRLSLFDPSSAYASQSWGCKSLIGTRDPLLQKLRTSGKTLVWAILGEKNVLPVDTHEDGYLRIRGVFWIDGDEIHGLDKAEYVERGESPSGEAHTTPDTTPEYKVPAISTLEDIEGIGKRKEEILRTAGFNDIEDLFGTERAELESIDGIGPNTIDSIESSLKILHFGELLEQVSEE